MFAYYYIWFNVSSWERAKSDYPTLGRYSSDVGRARLAYALALQDSSRPCP